MEQRGDDGESGHGELLPNLQQLFVWGFNKPQFLRQYDEWSVMKWLTAAGDMTDEESTLEDSDMDLD